MPSKFKIIVVLLGLFFFALYFVAATSALDPDFGWHLRTGQLVLSSGIPKVDSFSYTMPNYPFVDSSWLADVLLAGFFPLIGFSGLGVVFSFLTLLSLGIIFSIKKSPGTYISLTLFLLLTTAFEDFVTIRPLVFTWLCFSLLLWIVLEQKHFDRWQLFLPLLFLVWANLHGGFAVGLVSFGLIVLIKSIRQKKVLWREVVILFSSILVTLVNPYGWRWWKEVWLTISSPALRSSIAEWQSSVTSFVPAVMVIVCLTGGILMRYRKRFEPEKLVLYSVFLILGISAVRNLPLLTLLCIPLLFQGLGYFGLEVKKIKYGTVRFDKTVDLFLGLSIFLFLMKLLVNTIWSGSGGIGYPEKAINFLRVNQFSGEVFAPYAWGGYLIWKYPEKKVFIDGRMAIWQQNGYSAFEESQKIVKDEQDFQPVFAKYQIDTVLWPATRKSSSAWEKILEKMNSFFKIDESKKDLGQRLLEARWVEVYQDSVAVVYRRRG